MATSSVAVMKRVQLGSQGMEVSALGLGSMMMSMTGYGRPPKDEGEKIKLIHHTVNLGVTFVDTSDIYGPFTNEILIGKAIKDIRDKVQIATKFGVADWFLPNDPEYVRSECEASLKRLGVDCIDLYYLHRLNDSVPIQITVSGELHTLESNIAALGVKLTEGDIKALEDAVPMSEIAGDRHQRYLLNQSIGTQTPLSSWKGSV